MFTDLHQLKSGDMVYIHVLNKVLAYTVDEVNTVLPSDTSLLGIEQGKDRLTLITCTPVGVNTHRLLVRCCRMPYVQEDELAGGGGRAGNVHMAETIFYGYRLRRSGADHRFYLL